jgi:hypothetical protein
MLGSNLLRKARGHQVLNSEQRWLCLRLERLSLEAEVRFEAQAAFEGCGGCEDQRGIGRALSRGAAARVV